MTINEFQRIVIRLSNQMYVRHYLWLNYPNEPQTMALSLIDLANTTGSITTDGGHRLSRELEALGFVWDGSNGRYTIQRDLEQANTLRSGDATRAGGA